VDERYVKVAGCWRYAYRAIDQFGQVIDVFVCLHRDAKAARRFFERAIGVTKVTPAEVTHRSRAGVPGRAGGAVCQRPGTVPTGTPATGSRRITVG